MTSSWSTSLQPSCSTRSQISPNGMKLPNSEQQTPNPPKHSLTEIVITDIPAFLPKKIFLKIKQFPPRPEIYKRRHRRKRCHGRKMTSHKSKDVIGIIFLIIRQKTSKDVHTRHIHQKKSQMTKEVMDDKRCHRWRSCHNVKRRHRRQLSQQHQKT